MVTAIGTRAATPLPRQAGRPRNRGVDPGEHEITFTTSTGEHVAVRVVVSEGNHAQSVSATFGAPVSGKRQAATSTAKARGGAARSRVYESLLANGQVLGSRLRCGHHVGRCRQHLRLHRRGNEGLELRWRHVRRRHGEHALHGGDAVHPRESPGGGPHRRRRRDRSCSAIRSSARALVGAVEPLVGSGLWGGVPRRVVMGDAIQLILIASRGSDALGPNAQLLHRVVHMADRFRSQTSSIPRRTA